LEGQKYDCAIAFIEISSFTGVPLIVPAYPAFSVCTADSVPGDGGAVSKVASLVFQVRGATWFQKLFFESLGR